jgi:hypothetical protein
MPAQTVLPSPYYEILDGHDLGVEGGTLFNPLQSVVLYPYLQALLLHFSLCYNNFFNLVNYF